MGALYSSMIQIDRYLYACVPFIRGNVERMEWEHCTRAWMCVMDMREWIGGGWIGKGWEGEMRMKMRIMDVGGEGS